MSLRVTKLLAGLLLLAGFARGQGVYPLPVGSPFINQQIPRAQVKLSFGIPVYPDTTTANAWNTGADSLGMLIQIRSTGAMYKRDTIPWTGGGHFWNAVNSGGGGSDSGFNVVSQANLGGVPVKKSTAGPLRFVLWDSTATNPGAITTQASRQKLSDSLQGLIAARQPLLSNVGAGYRAYLPFSSVKTFFGRFGIKIDSVSNTNGLTFSGDTTYLATLLALSDTAAALRAISDTVVVLRLGQPGDTLVIGAGNAIYTPAIRDSLSFHHVINPDGSWTLYATGGSGGTPANPTGLVGLTANNGIATTYERSDATHALDQSIAPTWTGLHTFAGGATFTSSAPNGINYGGTFTTTANNQYMEGSNPSVTLRGTASDVFNSRSYTPAFTIGANNQTVNALSIVPSTTVGAFTGTVTNALYLGGNIALNATNTYNFGDALHVAARVYTRTILSDADVSFAPANNANESLGLIKGGVSFSALKGFGATGDWYMTRSTTSTDDAVSILHLNGRLTADSDFYATYIPSLNLTDTINYYPLAINKTTGRVVPQSHWQGGAGAGTTMTNTTFSMPLIQAYYAGFGLASSANVAGYTAASIDNVPFPFVSNGNGVGTEQGGWVVASTSGDSVLVSFPIGVAIGNSIIAGHTTRKGRLESSPFNLSYPDSAGQITYYLDSLTHMHWYNQGIGGQTMTQIRARFLRDAIGLISNPNDGKGGVTLSHKPSIIILEGGVNDVYAGIADSVIEQNFQWCAATAAYYNIPMIVLTVVGDGAGETVAQMQEIMRLNDWLMRGNLNQYGVTVVDIFGRWASGAYSNQIANGGLSINPLNSPQYPSTLVGGDKIHFTPAGYDSVALDIFNLGKPPVLDSVIISSPIAATNPLANVNRPNSVRFSPTTSYVSNHNPFLVNPIYSFGTAAVNATAVTDIFPDSVWLEIQSSTNITGTSTQTAIGGVSAHLNNNPTNANWYKAPVPFQGAPTNYVNSTAVNVTVAGNGGGIYPLQVWNYDGSNALALQSNSGASNSKLFINGNTPLSGYGVGGVINACNAAATSFGFSTTGGISAPGTGPSNAGNQLGSVMVGGTTNPTTTNYSLNVVSGKGYTMATSSASYSGESNMRIENVLEGTVNPAVSGTVSGLRITESSASGPVSNSIFQSVYINPVDSDFTSSASNKQWYGLVVVPHIISSTNQTIVAAARIDSGQIIFGNNTGDVTIGTSTDVSSAKLQVASTTQGAIPAPKMTTTQMNAISSPVAGLQVYNTDSNYVMVYNGSAWKGVQMTNNLPVNSGTYTPTLGNSLNVSSATLDKAYYTQIGNVIHVMVSGTATITTASTNSQISITLPVTTSLSSGHNLGVGNVSATSLSPQINMAGIIQWSATNTVTLYFPAASGTTGATVAWSTSFDYAP